jgi:hypothetical protein
VKYVSCREKFLLVYVAGILSANMAPAWAEELSLPGAAEEVCQSLFQMLDEGRLGETYALTAPVIRNIESQTSWYGQMSSERESMGEAGSRRLVRVEKVERFADLPQGDYFLVTYDTSFAAHPKSQEIVVLAGSEEEGYGLAAYRVRYDMWPEAISIIKNGLMIVFFIMALLATITWAVGRMMQKVNDKTDEK